MIDECRDYVDGLEERSVTPGLVHGVWADETARERIQRRFRERKAVQRERERIAV